MKKILPVAGLFLLVLLCGCKKEKSQTGNAPDIDMTKMSATMIYAEVFNMLIMPEEYTNKVIKVAGNFRVFEDETTGERFFAILIPDATKCCQQGIEFIWQGDHSYPGDYPAIDEEITITGTYNCKEYGDGATYTYLDVWQIDRK